MPEELQSSSRSLGSLRKTTLDTADSIGFTDSFHVGTADPGTFDTGLIRLFSMAIIELEYAFETIAEAAA